MSAQGGWTVVTDAGGREQFIAHAHIVRVSFQTVPATAGEADYGHPPDPEHSEAHVITLVSAFTLRDEQAETLYHDLRQAAGLPAQSFPARRTPAIPVEGGPG